MAVLLRLVLLSLLVGVVLAAAVTPGSPFDAAGLIRDAAKAVGGGGLVLAQLRLGKVGAAVRGAAGRA